MFPQILVEGRHHFRPILLLAEIHKVCHILVSEHYLLKTIPPEQPC